MPSKPIKRHADNWWNFTDKETSEPTGAFQARHTKNIGRLYFPLANESQALSWTSPDLRGGIARSHHEQLSIPLTAEDLSHSLTHRGFWITEKNRKPFSLVSDIQVKSHPSDSIDAGPGWFRLNRHAPQKRLLIQATLWCPSDLNSCVELMQIDVINTGIKTIRFIPYAALPLFARSADNIRDHRHVTALLHRIYRNSYGVIVRPTMSFDERGHKPNSTNYGTFALGPNHQKPSAIWANQDAFLGETGNFAAPDAVWNAQTEAPKEIRQGQEAIGGFRFKQQTLKPGQRASYLLISGITNKPNDFASWITKAKRKDFATLSLQSTKDFWQQKTREVVFKTSDRHLDQWLKWVNLQPHLRRIYGNSFLPQFDYGKGGRGWRDLWQDCLALLLSHPERVKPILLHNIGGVRIDGSNATIIGKDGEFIADRNNIPRTWMDHGTWPLHTILLYVNQTGDLKFLFERREYFRDSQIFRCKKQDPNWNSKKGFLLRTKQNHIYRSSVLEHLLVQSLAAFFNVGEHNLCRLEGADWNDGLDMAAVRGESVAFSSFYAWNLKRLAKLAHILQDNGTQTIEVFQELVLLLDHLPGKRKVNYSNAKAKTQALNLYLERVSKNISGRTVKIRLDHLIQDLLAKHDDLSLRIRKQEWVRSGSNQFFNGYYDNQGKRVEGKRGGKTRMTLTGQVFSLISGIASNAQLKQTIKSVDRLLRDPRSSGIRLNTDFGDTQPDLGRAFSFAYGEKENGAVFSHMAIMYAYALYLRRQPKAGRKVWLSLYEMATDQQSARIFPGLPEYFNAQGRGLYCYLTGSASWLVYLLLTQVYGIRGQWGNLVIDPQLIMDDFGEKKEIGVKIRFANRNLELIYTKPKRESKKSEGVVLARRFIQSLPANKTTILRVSLSL